MKPKNNLRKWIGILVMVIVLPLLFVTCEKDKDEPTGNNKMELSAITSTAVSYTSAEFLTTVNSTGNQRITDHGFCYSPEPAPDKNDSVLSLGTLPEKGSFNTIIQNLQPNARYYIRAFLTISAGTVYSQETSVFTLKTGKPKLVSDSVFAITPYTASYSGTLVSDSGLLLTSRGFCWGRNPAPGLSDSTRTIPLNENHFIAVIASLTNATNYYVRSFATNAAGTSFGNEISFTTTAILPSITVNNAANITTTFATSGGVVTNDGGAEVTARGVCWSTGENPTIFSNHTLDGDGTGSFTSDLTALIPSTTYFVRAYATNIAGTAYSGQVSFITSSIPTIPVVTTNNITNITTNYALGGGDVISDGGSSIITRGVCWSTTQNPTILGLHTTNGNGTGSFTSDLTSLTEATTYYVRAYSTNSIGTAYGNQVSFTTESVHTIPTVVTTSITAVTSNGAVSGGNVTSTGGDAVTSRGVCWSTSQNPTIAGSHTTDGSGSGSFISGLIGLNASTTYYVRAYAANISGTAYGEQLSFATLASPVLPTLITATVISVTNNSAVCGGNITDDGGATVTARGVCWSTAPNPIISGSHTTNGTGTGIFSSNISGLSASTTYYVRAYATNSAGTAYGGQQSFTTLAVITTPTLTTTSVTSVTATTAVSGGNVTNSGGANITARGVCWSTSQNPTIFVAHTNDGSGTGSFISNISGLNPTTTYYVRAYATNSEGTAYGNQVSFTTIVNITIPTLTTADVTDITSSTAIGGGNVTASGGATVTARGVCWSTSQNPTLNNNFTSDGSGTGSFISSITGLNPTTTYYVRAYGTNIQGTAYGIQVNFTTSSIGNQCNDFTLTHTAGGVAAVTKTVSYGVTLTDLSGETKCWITQNLGADIQASSENDNTEAAAGWYWQFNKYQGFKHDGATRTPNTTWVNPINENSNWISQQDPCRLLLGTNWRVPTVSEWQNVISNGGWNNYSNAYNSVLRLHSAGYLFYNTGNLTERSNYGLYWSSGQNNNLSSYNLFLAYGQCLIDYNDKSAALTVRCLGDGSTGLGSPSIVTSSISNIGQNSSQSGGDVTHNGGASVTARGVCWSTSQNPTLSDNFTTNGSGTGSYVSNLTGLSPSTTYYVSAYATNSVGTAYGDEESFTTTSAGFVCGNIMTINHTVGNVAPVSKAVDYGTVETNLTGSNKCWITQNLGADHQAISSTDATEASAGWNWQFNRQQGYKHDGITITPNTFLIGENSINEDSDWVVGNDPCKLLLGADWRLPTSTEWISADASGGWNNCFDTFASVLKMHAAGIIAPGDGSLYGRGTWGYNWSSNQYSNIGGNALYFGISLSYVGQYFKSYGSSVRCLKD